MLRRLRNALSTLLPLGISYGVADRAQAQQSPIDVGTLFSSQNGSEALAINKLAQAVGSSGGHAFFYANDTLIDLCNTPSDGTAAPPVPCPTQAWGINTVGQIVGQASVKPSPDAPQIFQRAFLYSAGQTFDLGTFGGNTSLARGINDLGQVVGAAETSVGTFHGFVFTGFGLLDVGTLGGGSSAAIAINNRGQAAGWAALPSNTVTHPFIWESGALTDLAPTLASGVSAEVYAINDTGDAAGAIFLSNSSRHAASWTNGVMNDLGTLGGALAEAYGIDSTGHIVGWSSTAEGASHAFLYAQGKMFDLNSLLPLYSGWELRYAFGITDTGYIVGEGLHDGLQRGFILFVNLNAPDSSCALPLSARRMILQTSSNCNCSGPPPSGLGWPRDATVRVYIQPQFTHAEADAIQEAFINWNVENLRNGAGVEFIFVDQPVSGNLTYSVIKGLTANTATTPTIDRDGRTVVAAMTTTDPFMPADILTGAIAHEIGHFFNLDDCPGCAAGSSVMRGVDVINGQYYLRGSTHPTDCDNVIVKQFYSLTASIM
jgi:probable HAF family extracellular repeat protein